MSDLFAPIPSFSTVPPEAAPVVSPVLPPTSIDSALLGTLPIDPERTLRFLNAENWFALGQEVMLLPAMHDGLFWMQSIEDRHETFLLVDPFLIFPDFSVDVPDAAITPVEIRMS